jgi:DNA invertase Pin-like site-specific DNA recombinase
MTSREKIRPQHLARSALVYIRQSTLGQVRHHHESQRRQYALADKARELGWSEVVVIDDDLGKSGASSAGRVGFQRLVATVSLGQAGAVFSLEVSRLARNNRDWYQLLDLCGLVDTLIIDAEGIYDLRQLNDRLLLGLKGTISEAELGWIRQRAYEGLLAKARRGELILRVPVGYVRARDGRIEKHPDQRVQEAIGSVFRKFTEQGSVRQTLLWFRQEQTRLPALEQDHAWGDRIVWRLPLYHTLLRMLQNPIYAGAYAFGRTTTRTRVIDGAARKTGGHRSESSQWIALLRDHHESYIGWETYERNRELIAHNAQSWGPMGIRGAARQGPSLLAGLLRCGRCGRRLYVRYAGSTKMACRYSCRGGVMNHGVQGGCISFGGLRVDEAMEREVLRVLTPAAIEAALESADKAGNDIETARSALELELREARYEAARAGRQYDAVEPENRLVADTLEQRWNAALQRVGALESRLEDLRRSQPQHVPPDRATLLELAQDFPAVWNDPATDHRTKKRLIRLLVEEIVARLPTEDAVELVIHWKGGKHTILRVPKNRPGQHRYCTSREVVDVVRDLARCLPDGQIARVLNRLGYQTGAGNTWTQDRVVGLRSYHQIAVFDPEIERGTTLTIAQAASELGVSAMTVRRTILRGLLPAKQPVPYAPWAIQREALNAGAVQQAIKAVKRGRPVPQTAPTGQLNLMNSGA